MLLIFTKFDKYIAEDISILLEVNNETEYKISKRNNNLASIKNDLNIIYTNNNLNCSLMKLLMDIFNICSKLLDKTTSNWNNINRINIDKKFECEKKCK